MIQNNRKMIKNGTKIRFNELHWTLQVCVLLAWLVILITVGGFILGFTVGLIETFV